MPKNTAILLNRRKNRPERHRPPPNLPTTIPLKRTVDVGQQPQRREAGRCRSVGVRARWNWRRLARARDHSYHDQRCQIPLIFPSRSGRSAERARESATTVGAAEFAIVVDDPVPRCARSAPAPSPPPRPGEADQHRRRSPERHRPPPEFANTNSAKKNCRRRPAAAAPPSRPEPVKQVGLLAERAGIRRRLARARDHSTIG